MDEIKDTMKEYFNTPDGGDHLERLIKKAFDELSPEEQVRIRQKVKE